MALAGTERDNALIGSKTWADHGLEVSVARELGAVEDLWRLAETRLVASPYQCFDLCALWFDTIGRAEGAKPAIIVSRDATGAPDFLLPLAVTRRGLWHIAEIAGGRHVNLTLPLFAAEIWAAARRADVARLLIAAADAAEIDAFLLPHVPEAFAGARNPLRLLDHQRSANTARVATLDGGADVALRRLRGGGALKKLRGKEHKLAERGALRHVVAQDGATASRLIAAFFAQKAEWFAARRQVDGFATPAARAFYERLAGRAGFELHGLMLDDRVIATFGGVRHEDRFSGAINSCELGALAPFSPGDILLRHVIGHAADTGIKRFDLGVGEAEYKRRWLDEDEPLVDVFFGVGPLGIAAAQAAALAHRLKRHVKASPRLMRMASWLGRGLARPRGR